MTVADKSGKVVRTLRNLPRDAGVNRTTWDLRLEPPAGGGGGRGGSGAPAAAGGGRGGRGAPAAPDVATPDEEPGGEGRGGGRGGAAGIAVLPGDYTVTLTVGDKKFSKPLHVEIDPRVKVAEADLVAQFNASTKMQALAERVGQVIASVDDIARQLTALSDQLRPAGGGRGARTGADSTSVMQQGGGGATAAAYVAVQTALTKLRSFRDDELARPLPGLGYRQYPRLREEVQTLSGMIGRAVAAPTDPSMGRMTELEGETTQAEAKLNAIITDDVTKINGMLTGVPHVITRPAPRVVP